MLLSHYDTLRDAFVNFFFPGQLHARSNFAAENELTMFRKCYMYNFVTRNFLHE